MPMRSKSLMTLAAATLSLAGMVSAGYACGPGKLGISRTVTIDTAGGKLYGGLQYKSESFLKNREVVLTFDDGPLRRHTRKVLKALRAHCTKGTFFMVGRMAVADPAMVREVEAAGHTIAHHTWSHKNLKRRSAGRAGGEIELGISAVQAAAKNPTAPFFRFPYLADPNSMISYGKQRNLGIFSIDIDSYDYKSSSSKVYSNVMRQLRSRGKGIMLFHDIQSSTAKSIRRLLDTMAREGFKIVHIKAKAPVKTLSSYDERAQKLHSKRRTVATAKAIAGGSYEKDARPRRRIRSKKPVKRSETRVASRRQKPAQTVVNPFSNGRPAKAPARPVRPPKDWRRSVWGN